MKNSIKSWDISEDSKRFRILAQAAWDRFNEDGYMRDEEEARYYEGLMEKLNDLAWHYACLVSEGVFED